MKSLVVMGVGLVLTGTIAMAAPRASSESQLVPGGDPLKRSCAFSSEVVPTPNPSPESPAPAPPPHTRPPGMAANEVIGPTADRRGDVVEAPEGSQTSPAGSVFLS